MNSSLRTFQDGAVTEIANQRVKARFSVTEAGVTQEFFASSDGSWILVAFSFCPQPSRPVDGLGLYDVSLAPEHRLIPGGGLSTVQNIVRQDDRASVILSGLIGNHQ